MDTLALKQYLPVLNALAEMQDSKVYAVRAQDLQLAEKTIVRLVTELESVKLKLTAAQASTDQWNAMQLLQNKKSSDFKQMLKESAG